MAEDTGKIKLPRTKNAVRNMAAGFVNKTVTLLLPFVLRTVLIKRIGIEYAGLNGLFSSILQILNLSELGFAQAVVYSMYKPIAENDGDVICALLNFYRKAYFLIGCVILVLGLCVLPFLPHLIKGEIPHDVSIYLLYLIFLFNAAISYLLFGYKQSLFNAWQRQDVLSNILTLTHGAMSVAQIVILLAAKSYYGYVLMMPVFTVTNNVIVAAATRRKFPQYTCRGKLPPNMKKDIRRKVSGLMISRLCQTSRNSLDNIFISAFLGLTVTAIYSNYFLILTAVNGFLGVITISMMAGVGNSIQTETTEKNYMDMRKFNFLYMWISGWCTVCMVCLYQPFMKFWMGKENMFEYGAVILLCVYFYLLKAGDVRSLYVGATGLWWESKWRAMLEMIANLILNFLFIKRFGVNGIISGTLISLFIFNFVGGSQIFFHCYFGRSQETTKKIIRYFFDHGIYFIVTCLVCFCCTTVIRFIGMKFIVNPLINLFLTFFICTILVNVIYFICYFPREEFNITIGNFRR